MSRILAPLVPMTTTAAPVSRLRILAYSLLVAPVAALVALSFILAPDGIGDPPAWSLLVVAGTGAVAMAGLLTVGYRVSAISPTLSREEIDARAPALFTTGLILRSALCELPLLVAIGLAFVVADGGLLATTGLERNGAAVPLHAILHGDPH
jgi:hypothetical protein